MNREKFERLPEIKKTINKYDGHRVCEKYSTYDTSATAWLNGAWYAYQEQQKQIDEMQQDFKDRFEELLK